MNWAKTKTAGRILIHLFIIRPFLKLFCGVNLRGGQNLSGLNQFILIANHNSHLDVLLLSLLLPLGEIDRTTPIAHYGYFDRHRWLFRLVEFLFRPVWITRGQTAAGDDPLAEARRRLNEGHSLIVFPEGTRGEPGVMEYFKSGIGRLVVDFPNVPVVPVWLTGPDRALPKATALLLPFWNYVVVGPPQRLVGSHRQITRHLEKILHELAASETVRRHRRLSARKRVSAAVAVLGIDGSGKSSVAREIAQELSASGTTCLVGDDLVFFEEREPQQFQPLLADRVRRLVGAYAKRARSLKHYKIPKLTELLLRDHLFQEVQRWYSPKLIVFDGSPLLNMAAWSVLYRTEPVSDGALIKAIGILAGRDRHTGRRDPIFSAFPELLLLRRLGLNRLVVPGLAIMLDTSPSTACQRIGSRGADRQVHETEEKLTALRSAYLQVLRLVGRHLEVSTAVIDGENSLSDVTAETIGAVENYLNTLRPADEPPD